jgi:hypothetical protein
MPVVVFAGRRLLVEAAALPRLRLEPVTIVQEKERSLLACLLLAGVLVAVVSAIVQQANRV